MCIFCSTFAGAFEKSISDKACLITLRRGEGWVSG